MSERWIDELRQLPDGGRSRPGFRDELRDTLAAVWDDEHAPFQLHSGGGRGWNARWWAIGAAAVLVAALIGGLVVVNLGEHSPVAPVATSDTTDGSVSPSTSDAPATSATPTSSEPATTEGAAVEVPVGLQNWPTSSADPVTIAAVPALLPTVPVTGAITATRFETAEQTAGLSLFTQTWFASDGDAYFVVTTTVGSVPTLPEDLPNAVDTSGWPTSWDAASFATSAPPYLNLQLSTAGGFVEVQTFGLTEADVLDIARSLQRRPEPAAGWDVPSIDGRFVMFGEGVASPYASRALVWHDPNGGVVAELVVGSYAELMTTGWVAESQADFIDVNGVQAVLIESGGRVAIAWPLGDDMFAVFGFQGDRAEAEAIARGFAPVDDATWRAASQPPNPNDDGCQGMFC